MAGRAKIVIDAKKLSLYEDLVWELEQRGHTINDNSRLKITFLSPYTPRMSYNIKHLIGKLEKYIFSNGNKTVQKSELSEILGISRPTLDKWIRQGWLEIDPPRDDLFNNGVAFKIDLNNIKNQLMNMALHLLPKHDFGNKKIAKVKTCLL